MKLLTKLIGIGLIAAAAVSYDRARLRRAGRLDALGVGGRGLGMDAGDMDIGFMGAEPEVVVDAVIVGISDVDPVPLSNMAGEGIDRDAVDEAHRSVGDQRDRLPRTDKPMR